MFDILFKNITVITMRDSAPLLYNAYVGVKNGKIAYVADREPQEEAKRTICGEKKLMMPGLINCHAHTAMTLLRGYADDYALQPWLFEKVFPAEARLTPRAVLAGFKLGAAEMLASGITSFSDMYMFMPDVAKFALEAGLRFNACNAILSLSPEDDIEKSRAMQETMQLISTYHGAGNGRIRADIGIHAQYTSRPENWRRMADLAEEHKLVTHLHLSETRKEHENCIAEFGKTPARMFYENGVFRNPVLAAHCVWVSNEDVDLLAENGVSAAHNPVSNLKLASGIAPVNKMLQRGVNVCLGTDGCCSNNTHDLFEELKLAALLQKGTLLDPTVLPAYEALKLATVNGAKAQGRSGEIGCIEEGYDADLILLDLCAPHMFPAPDPLSSVVYCARGSDVALTMVQGRILYEDGAFTTIDMDGILKEMATYAVPLAHGKL